MRSTTLKAVLKTAISAVAVLLLTAGASFAQSVDFKAAPTTTTLPDGQVVPMWGYTCTGTPVAPATCAASNPNAGTGWSPVVITVPPGNLTINLTNNLSFGTNSVPTSLMIVGQLGGGLGGAPTKTTSPTHAPQVVTWPIAGANPPAAGAPTFNPPSQLGRVQSFGTEVAAGATTALSWTGLKPGTYLIESGTHPSIQGPMGLYGILVVTTAPSGATPGTAYAGVTYDKEVPVLLSEIDPLQNTTVSKAVKTTGFSETTVWSGQPGQCGNPTSANYLTCYPPVVNYDPRYYLINGVSFDKTRAANSVLAATGDTAATGTVLVRFVNAGLRMHVPSIVGALTGTPAVSGFSLIAEDGNLLPGNPRIQNEVLLPAGKVYDVMMNQPASGTDFPVFDRQLSLSTNNQRDGGMQAYINVNGGALPVAGAFATAVANPDTYSLVAGTTLNVSDPAKGVIANDIGVYGVAVAPTTVLHVGSTLTLNLDGTFTYVPGPGVTSDTFAYMANGNPALTATVTLGPCTGTCLGGAPVANADSYASSIASRLHIGAPGVLANDTDPAGHPLTAVPTGSVTGGTVTLNADGSFTVVPTTPPTGIATAVVTFQYNAVNSQKTASAAPATVTVTFNGGSGLQVHVFDALTYQASLTAKSATIPVELHDYRWIIEEDRTFNIDPACQVNATPRPAGCPALPVPSLGTNFHTSYMPVVAAGCVGTVACESGQTLVNPATGVHSPAVCDLGNGVCETTSGQQAPVLPSQVHLDPTKRYYISILPGDAGNPFSHGAGAPVALAGGKLRPFSITLDCPSGPGGADFNPGTGTCGHGMGGAPIGIGPAQASVKVLLQQTPFPPAKVSVFVFEDDSPLNGENDTEGAATSEPGLGGFEITLFDDAGGTGDATGQMTYDMFNMPLSNSLAGTIDPTTGFDACPISATSADRLVGMIVTCPNYENGVSSTGAPILSPLRGQAIIANMMPGRYGVVATPGADRIARGEEWLQTNTLDGQKAHDSFMKIGGPGYFQEFGPSGFHVSVGFANPKIINDRLAQVCPTTVVCTSTVTGTITNMRLSRTPDQRIYSSGSNQGLSFTQCYVSLGDPVGEDFAFTKCDSTGKFTLSNLPAGKWRLTIFDQWNDQIVDGHSTPVALTAGATVDMNDIPETNWKTNLSTATFFDRNGNGVRDKGETGLTLVPTNIRFRDGSYSNFNNTDLNGNAGFNEIFPLFNWYVVEADTTRYKQTGVHVVYDAGGAADCTTPAGVTPAPPCSAIAGNLASSGETFHLPTNLRVPGAVYCATADCTGASIKNGPASGSATPSTGRIDPPSVTTEGWQGFLGQYSFIEFGKAPYQPGENGGIKGEVIYASTRPFDDPAMLIHTSWTPNVPGVTVNLYQEGTAPDGTQSLKLVDTTVTSSWDNWAQGVRSDGVPNMNCPGQDPTSLFFFTLRNSTQWLNPTTPLPNNSQFKCYDGLAVFNQVQPAPYDGMYKFPSVTATSPTTGLPTGTNCTICVANPAGDGTMMLPAGKYVVEMILPQGYELVKEEDKNILIGDNYIAPVSQQFAGLGSIFILPDQAEVASQYNPNNAQNPTNNLGSTPRAEGDTGSVETKWPCVGRLRLVPDFISLFPQSGEVAPFAGAYRHLCDRKEVNLEDQTSALAKFWVFSSTHVAAHYTGIITDDLSSEFDPFSPQFGEKFAVPNLPISFKDYTGVEISRTYSDQWGSFNGLNYSTWEVNPPNPTGYGPTMMVACMNDPGPIPDPLHPGQKITDPLYNPAYSQFCYETPFMPGQTQYMDTPVVPTAAFADGYNQVDCAYPDTTPAIASVIGNDATGAVPGSSGLGPWVSASGTGHTLTITALGDQKVANHGYTGPQATAAPFNQKFITRHYGFGPRPSTCPAAGNCPNATIGGIPMTNVAWSDTTITGQVPSLTTGQSSCTIQQRGVANAAATRCGELAITSGNGQRSIDTVTVTIGGKAPTYVNGENSANRAIQTAIDNATPGDLIIVGPGTYNEMLLMWKPVRLQGVGAASVTVNANTQPSGKMDTWRRQVTCLFGVAINGGAIGTTNPYDPTGTYSCPLTMQKKVDPIPNEAIFSWDASLNANVAELLQEPTLMGAYEGAAITVLGQGMANSTVTPPVLLTNSTTDCAPATNGSNFLCNPSRIDGITFTNSSQGGGGIWLHGWNHYTEVSNNRVMSNSGLLTGGITVGQPEGPLATFDALGHQIPFSEDTHVHIHHNSVTSNVSFADAAPSRAGGVTMCLGSDYYKFDYNWVCGNLSMGDGGGFAQLGFSVNDANGGIAHNSFLFNQSTNPTITTYGGGIVVEDQNPAAGDGTGPGLVIDSNLIMGNTAENGSGGGLRLQGVNGSEVSRFPTNSSEWYGVTITNNIISNNVAGWDGGGVSLQDALKVNFINNTVIANDSTASAGPLFATTNVQPGNPAVTTTNQPAGLVAWPNSPNLTSFLPANPPCPTGHPNCAKISNPLLQNNVFYQNRSFHIQVGGLGTGILNQQNTVALVPTLNQTSSGACSTGATYWDIGVAGDTSATPLTGPNAVVLSPTYSILTSTTGYGSAAAHNLQANPNVVREYCNGSKVPPENGGMGYQVPPSTTEAILPNPLFNLTPSATVDEGNNWINMSYGPLSMFNSAIPSGAGGYGVPLGNYGIAQGSPAIGFVPQNTANFTAAPALDFFGTPRKANGSVDIGAVQFVAASSFVLNPTSLTLTSPLGGTSGPQVVTVTNAGNTALNLNISLGGTNPGQFSQTSTGCGTVAVGGNCTINVAFNPTTATPNPKSALLNVTAGGQTLAVSLTGNIQALPYSVTPASLAFNSPVNVTSAPQTVTVNNAGTTPLTFTIALAGTNPTQFNQTSTGCASVAAGGSCTINVTFLPTSTVPNPMSAVLNVNAGAGTTTLSVQLTGTVTIVNGITLVQSNAAQGSFVGSLSVPFTTAANTAGNLIIAFVRMSSAGQTVAVADSLGNAYTDAVAQTQTSDGHQVHLFYARNIRAGANTVTATFSGTNGHPWLAIYEYNGLSTTNPLDRTATGQGSGTTPSTGPTLTTTTANELIFAGTGLPSSYTGTQAAGAGFILGQNDSGASGTSPAATETMMVTTTASYTGAFTLGSSAQWSAVVATFAAGNSVSVTTSSLPAATQNVAYTTTLAATGGTTPYTWSIASGALPAGLTLAANTGVISGTPTVVGTSNFTVHVTDTSSPTGANQVLTLTVNAPAALAITTTTLPAGTQNTAYTTTLAASGGTTPYTWSMAAGTLPNGLTLSGAGVISGTPTVAGTSNFTVRVTDAAAATTTRALSLTVNPPAPPAITTTTLPGGTQNAAYTATLAATGGTTPYNWSIFSGTLPTGLTLAPSTGVISGTPSVAGTSNFTVRVTDANLTTANQALSLIVAVPPVVTTTTLAAGTQNAAYTATLAATGGTTPYAWSIFSGTLPAGLTLAPSTGVISGTPSVAGTSNFTVRVTDANLATANQALSLTINPGAAIALVQSSAIQGSGVPSVSAGFTAANTAGNLIVVAVRMSTAGQSVAVTDTLGNAYVQAVAQSQTTDGSQVRIFYARNILGGANTVTATFSAANNHPWLNINEYRGLSTTSPLDQTAAAQSAALTPTPTPSAGPTATTTSGNELVFAAFGFPSSYTGTQTAGSGFGIVQNDTSTSPAATESRLVTTTGPQTGTFTLGTAANWSAVVATFK